MVKVTVMANSLPVTQGNGNKVSNEHGENASQSDQQYSENFLSEGPQVSSPARKSMALIILFVGVLGILLYNLISSDDVVEEEERPDRKLSVARRDSIPAPASRIQTPTPPPLAPPRRGRESLKTVKTPFRDQITGTITKEYILIPRKTGRYIIPAITPIMPHTIV